MEAIAKTRYLKGSPRKARLVIDLIRGRNVSQALSILKFTNKRAAEPITKTLRSAIANATYQAEQQNIAIDPDSLWVRTCFVDMGPTKNRRRVRPAPQGRAFREQRHYCHITIAVTSEAPPKDEKALKREAAAAKKAEAAESKPKAPAKEAKKAAKPKAAKKVEAEVVETVESTPVDAIADTAVTEVKAEVEAADVKIEEAVEEQVAGDDPQELNEEPERQ